MVERLDGFLGKPKFDPHGDPIPDADGNFAFRKQILLADMHPGDQGVVVGVQDHTTAFLQYLDRLDLVLGVDIEMVERFFSLKNQKKYNNEIFKIILTLVNA